MSQLMPLPLTVSCSSKIQIGFTFLVPAHLGSPGKGAVKRVCVVYPKSCLTKYKMHKVVVAFLNSACTKNRNHDLLEDVVWFAVKLIKLFHMLLISCWSASFSVLWQLTNCLCYHNYYVLSQCFLALMLCLIQIHVF